MVWHGMARHDCGKRRGQAGRGVTSRGGGAWPPARRVSAGVGAWPAAPVPGAQRWRRRRSWSGCGWRGPAWPSPSSPAAATRKVGSGGRVKEEEEEEGRGGSSAPVPPRGGCVSVSARLRGGLRARSGNAAHSPARAPGAGERAGGGHPSLVFPPHGGRVGASHPRRFPIPIPIPIPPPPGAPSVGCHGPHGGSPTVGSPPPGDKQLFLICLALGRLLICSSHPCTEFPWSLPAWALPLPPLEGTLRGHL